MQRADRIEWSQVMDVAPSDGAVQLFNRRALDSLSNAVKSALYSKEAEQEVIYLLSTSKNGNGTIYGLLLLEYGL